MDAPDKNCPFCAEPIKAEAIRCKHCQVSLLTGTADGAPPPKSKKPIWPWIILTPLLILGTLMVVGAMSGPPDEKTKARSAIDLCWKGVDDELQSLSTRRFVRGTCQMMVEKYETKYGRSPTLRRE
ncbi:hypothetical protein [Pseudomonas umsongensis]|uniref:Zinc ribbon domain-containing protein n=1 Tax=Pseudomonas umsongensis TaxID=198618 RepID=A0AAE6ZV74_9PSED|nr:hypothetical protein [Pseudomonas umsongensis]QJC78934.1 hypothetical protein HGP31_11635 [Pseudomonas umsongensis]